MEQMSNGLQNEKIAQITCSAEPNSIFHNIKDSYRQLQQNVMASFFPPTFVCAQSCQQSERQTKGFGKMPMPWLYTWQMNNNKKTQQIKCCFVWCHNPLHLNHHLILFIYIYTLLSLSPTKFDWISHAFHSPVFCHIVYILINDSKYKISATRISCHEPQLFKLFQQSPQLLRNWKVS